MNQTFQRLRRLVAALLLLAACLTGQAQNTATCNLTIGKENFPVNASVQATSLTGLDFNVFITLPGLGAKDCPGGGKYDVSITPSSNLLYTGNSGSLVPFTPCPAPTYCNAIPILNNEGTSIPVTFKFKPGVTCDGEEGTFDITVRTTCGGQTYSCSLTISLTAVAKNYWKVKKEHLWGNLKGGQIIWKITLENDHSQVNTQPGIGDYDIAAGKISDHINCDSVIAVSGGYAGGPIGLTGLRKPTAYWSTGKIPSTVRKVEYIVTTVCCDPTATEATNCVTYSLNLGVSFQSPMLNFTCEPFTGTVCASVPLVTASGCVVPFTKTLTTYASGIPVNYATGCQGEYTIAISNTGNTPLTNLVVTDIFPPASDIVIFKAYVYSIGNVNMDYNIHSTYAGLITPPTLIDYKGNVNNSTEFPSPTVQFSSPLQSLTFTTTSGSRPMERFISNYASESRPLPVR